MLESTPLGLMSTPLFPLYREYGAKVVDFHGWALPVQFSGVIKEHEAVRSSAGLFDISHMGEIVLAGNRALDLVQKLTINDASRLQDGQVQYSAMCLPDGGIIDDITVYRFSAEKYLLCVNAANLLQAKIGNETEQFHAGLCAENWFKCDILCNAVETVIVGVNEVAVG